MGGVNHHAARLDVGKAHRRFVLLLEQVEVKLLLHFLAALHGNILALRGGHFADYGVCLPGLLAKFVEAQLGGLHGLVDRGVDVGAHRGELLVDQT